MRLETGTFKCGLRSSDAAISSITFKALGKEIVQSSAAVPFFHLTVMDRQQNMMTVYPFNGSLTDEGKLSFSGMKGDGAVYEGIHAELSACSEDDEAIAFYLSIDNHEPSIDIVNIMCLRLAGVTYDNPEESALLYPHHAGEKIVDPIQTMRSERYLNFWRAASHVTEDGRFIRENNYCGLMSMTWMYLQSPGIGLYVGSHDPSFPVTGLLAETGGENLGWMGFGYRIHHRIRPGENWNSAAFVLSVNGRDWHTGAERYRAYINPYLGKQENPEYLKSQASLHQCYQFKRADGIHNRFSDIPQLFDLGASEGIRHMFIASWNRTGFDSDYPEYYPDMELGTALDFRRGISHIRQNGGFATLYVNARLFDKKSVFHKSYGLKMAITDPFQKPYEETYGVNSFTINCPGDDQWQHDLTDICDFAAEAYGAQGMYLDQLGSAEPFPCFHEGHSHEDVGEFNRGYLQVLSDLRTRLRARNPNSYLMIENCGDIYGPYVWGSLTWNGADYDEFYNLYRYTFPEHVQVNMCNTRAWEPEGPRKSAYLISDIARCVLMGNILWIGLDSRYSNPKLEAERDYVLKAHHFRERISRYVANGLYLDDQYVVSCPSGFAASCWSTTDKQYMLLAARLGEGEDVLDFVMPDSVKLIESFDEKGNDVRQNIALSRNRVQIHTGQTRLLCFVLGTET